MAGAQTEGTVTQLDRWRARRAETSRTDPRYTIKDVVDACRLPGPVIMQLAPRTWTDAGWMYTAEQLDAAVTIADDLRRHRAAQRDDVADDLRRDRAATQQDNTALGFPFRVADFPS
jgi:hypothetical protein